MTMRLRIYFQRIHRKHFKKLIMYVPIRIYNQQCILHMIALPILTNNLMDFGLL